MRIFGLRSNKVEIVLLVSEFILSHSCLEGVRTFSLDVRDKFMEPQHFKVEPGRTIADRNRNGFYELEVCRLMCENILSVDSNPICMKELTISMNVGE